MVISNWVEKKLEERRLRRLAAIREQGREEGFEQGRKEGREEGFEQGRAYERERIEAETNGQASDDPYRENGR